MELRRELILAIGTLVLLNALLAFGAIGLFVRMGPAIEQILEENVTSIVAAEEIVGTLAESSGRPVSPEREERIRAGLQRLQTNVTEPDERDILARVELRLPLALEGDPDAVVEEVSLLRELIRVNRDAMRRADEQARRLGTAGAWAAVFVGFVSFAGSVVVFRRFRRRVVEPLVDLYQVLEDVRAGDRFRRARPRGAPAELLQVRNAVNALLDERIAPKRSGEETDPRLLRRGLTELLSREESPTVLTDRDGRVVAGNDPALAELAGPRGDEIRQALEDVADEGAATGEEAEESAGVEGLELPNGGGWLCHWSAAAKD